MANKMENRIYHKISYRDIEAFMDAHVYGTATPMIWLIKRLKVIKNEIYSGIDVSYMDEQWVEHKLTPMNFKEFCEEYFDYFVYKEVMENSPMYD